MLLFLLLLLYTQIFISCQVLTFYILYVVSRYTIFVIVVVVVIVVAAIFFLFSLTNSFTQKSTKHKTNKFCGFFSNSEIVVRYYYKITKRQTTLFFFSFSHSHTEHHFWCLFWSAIKKKYKVNNHRLSLPVSNTKKKTMCKKLKTNTITQIQKHWKCHMMLKKLTDDHTDSDFHLADHNYPNKLKKKVQ